MESTPFFSLLRTHTMMGFLADPRYGGNPAGREIQVRLRDEYSIMIG